MWTFLSRVSEGRLHLGDFPQPILDGGTVILALSGRLEMAVAPVILAISDNEAISSSHQDASEVPYRMVVATWPTGSRMVKPGIV